MTTATAWCSMTSTEVGAQRCEGINVLSREGSCPFGPRVPPSEAGPIEKMGRLCGKGWEFCHIQEQGWPESLKSLVRVLCGSVRRGRKSGPLCPLQWIRKGLQEVLYPNVTVSCSLCVCQLLELLHLTHSFFLPNFLLKPPLKDSDLLLLSCREKEA